MMISKLKFYAHRSPCWNGVEINIMRLTSNSSEIMLPPTFETIADGTRPVHPSMVLQYDEPQELMDQLWSCGIRPTEGSGSAGSLAATERHLMDMQRIVFKDFK